jgi:3-oxoacyl-[acyl-carrier protein] reductase
MKPSERRQQAPRTAIVTGAARGIGREIARRLIAEGIEVSIIDISTEAQAAAEAIGASGALRVDVTEIESLRRAIDEVATRHGRLDVLVNCAGTCGRDSFEDLSLSMWRRDIDTNLTATAFACHAAVFPHMRQQGWGRLVNIASVSAKVGGVGPVHPDGSGGRSGIAYASAKAGVVNLTRWIARQVGGWGITCNAVIPGPISSAMTASATYDIGGLPIPRMGTPSEVAAAVAYLVGPDSGYTTGACMHVDGGMVLA